MLGTARRDLPRWSAVSVEPTPPAVVAAFDVDGTVTTDDCVVPFLRRVAGTAAARRRGSGAGVLRHLPAARAA